MPRRSPTKIKNNIQMALRMRPMEINELAITIGSDYRATQKYAEELEQLGVLERVKGLRKGTILFQNARIRKSLPLADSQNLGDFIKREVEHAN